MLNRSVRRRWMPAVALASGTVLGVGCTPTPAAPPPEQLQLSDVETVFVGFNDPASRVGDRIMRLYGSDSVPLSMTASQVDDATVNVEVRNHEDNDFGTSGVRCFVYTLDTATQQAHLEDFTDGVCPAFADQEAGG